VLAVGLIQLVLWPFAESNLRAPLCIAIVVVCVVSVRRSRQLRLANSGGTKTAWSSWARTAAITCLLAVAVLAFGWFMGFWGHAGPLRLPTEPLFHWLAVKLPTVVVQQVLLQIFLLPLVLEIVGRPGIAVLLCGAIFAFIHLPNTWLVLLTFSAGTIWCGLYLRHGRIGPLAASHYVLAIVAASAFNVHVLSLRVGAECRELQPSELSLADGQTVPVFPAVVLGRVRDCRQHGNSVQVDGWAVEIRRSLVVKELVVCVNGQLKNLPLRRHRVPCSKVARALGDSALEDCGFSVELPAEWFAEPNEVRFFGRSVEGAISELRYPRNYRWARADSAQRVLR
jgi:membrane protease YdiL (CAAX protease family)